MLCFAATYEWLSSVARAELCVRQRPWCLQKANALSTLELAFNDILALSKKDLHLAQIAQCGANYTTGME